jgi:signal transduction histidine kinase
MSENDEDKQQRQLERLDQQAVNGWLKASEKLDVEVERDRSVGDRQHEIRALQQEVEALNGLNRSLDRALDDGGSVPSGTYADDQETLQWLRDNLDDIQIRLGALAEDIKENAAITEETRQELLAQYEELRDELDDLEDDPERARSALEALRRFVHMVAHYMERVVHDWLPIARVLLPLLGPGAAHIGTPHDPNP